MCANINLLMEKEEEDFEKYLGTFATDIWTLLTTVSLEPRQVSRKQHLDRPHLSTAAGCTLFCAAQLPRGQLAINCQCNSQLKQRAARRYAHLLSKEVLAGSAVES